MGTLAELEARMQRIEDVEAIKRLKYKYWRCLDSNRWEEMRDCFTADITTSYTDGALKLHGPDAIVNTLSKSSGERRKSGVAGFHMGIHPEIEITSPTTAKGLWTFTFILLDPNSKQVRGQAAYYRDDYLKVNGAWKIKHTGYKLLFEPKYKLEELQVIFGPSSYRGDAEDAAAALTAK